MKHVIKNSALVFVLASLFVVPMFGFSFIGYNADDNVLGVSSSVPTKENIKQRTVDGMSAQNIKSEYKLVDQIDLKLSLSGDSYQKFYDVVSEDQIDPAYTYLVVVPTELQDKGMKAKIEVNQLKADIVVTVPDNFETQIVPVSIIILR